LLNDDYISKIRRVKGLQKVIKEKKSKISEDKTLLYENSNMLNRKKKENLLLDRVSKLVSSGLISKDSNLKNEIVTLLKIVESVPDSKLDQYLSETVKYFGKRLTKTS